MTAAEAMVAATARLRAAGVPDPARDARVLLAHAAQVDAARVTLIAPEDIAPDIAERYDNLIALRAVRVPVSQLIGKRGFYGRSFAVTADVLDPRPESETLIEAALAEDFARILDLGTGSGFSVREVISESKVVTNREVPYTIGPRRGGDCTRLVSGSVRAKEELGWEPHRSTLQQMISDAWRWHQTGSYER